MGAGRERREWRPRLSDQPASVHGRHRRGQRRIAARHLLVSPILTAARNPAELDLVRRHAPALKSMFASQLGYALIVESDVRPAGQGAAARVRAGAPGPPR